MDVAEIIGQGFELYKRNWKRLLLLGIIMSPFIMAEALISSVLPIIDMIIYFLFSPIFASGYYLYFVRIWRNDTPRLSVLFHYCHSFKKYGRVLLFYVCYYCSFLLFFIGFLLLSIILIFILNFFFKYSRAIYIIDIICILFFFVIFIWFISRMFLCKYLFLFQEKKPLWGTIKEGFKKMKGNVGRLIWLTFLQYILIILFVGLPISAIFMLVSMLDPDVMIYGILSVFAVFFLTNLFSIPYIGIIQAGFASEILHDLTWEGQIVTEKENIDE